MEHSQKTEKQLFRWRGALGFSGYLASGSRRMRTMDFLVCVSDPCCVGDLCLVLCVLLVGLCLVLRCVLVPLCCGDSSGNNSRITAGEGWMSWPVGSFCLHVWKACRGHTGECYRARTKLSGSSASGGRPLFMTCAGRFRGPVAHLTLSYPEQRP